MYKLIKDVFQKVKSFAQIANCVCSNSTYSQLFKDVRKVKIRKIYLIFTPDHPELVAADAEILDVGCGNGLLTVDLAKEGFQVGI